MLKGMRLSETADFISQFDEAKTEEEGATVFVLGVLDSNVLAHIGDATTNVINMKFEASRAAYMTVQFGLRGWRNFKDEDGGDIPFKTVKTTVGGREYQTVSPKTMDNLPPQIIGELANKIRETNTLTKDEVKNSDGE